MNTLLENEIDSYIAGSRRTPLQVNNKTFSDESISNYILHSSSFKKLNLLNLNLSDINFDSSFFNECVFKNCTFNKLSFQEAIFENCSLINCRIKDCTLAKSNFTETVFDKCCFEIIKEGSLIKAWFESCHFIETNFNGFDSIRVIQTVVVDSKFSKFDKSIEFKGEFFFFDIFYSKNGINQMFIE